MGNHTIQVLAILALFVPGCGVPHFQGVEEFVGTWVATSESLARLPNAPGNNCVMDLRADGSCRVGNLPDLAYHTTDRVKGAFASGTGKWRLSASAGEQVLLCELIDFPGSDTGHSIIEVRIRKVGSDLRLFFFIGDPDERNVFEFEKRR